MGLRRLGKRPIKPWNSRSTWGERQTRSGFSSLYRSDNNGWKQNNIFISTETMHAPSLTSSSLPRVVRVRSISYFLHVNTEYFRSFPFPPARAIWLWGCFNLDCANTGFDHAVPSVSVHVCCLSLLCLIMMLLIHEWICKVCTVNTVINSITVDSHWKVPSGSLIPFEDHS